MRDNLSAMANKPSPRRATFLRAWRKFRGLTQEAAADAIGYDRTALSRVERGEIGYSQDFLEPASIVYGCTPADLIGVDPSNARESELLAAWRAAPASIQRTVEIVLTESARGLFAPGAVTAAGKAAYTPLPDEDEPGPLDEGVLTRQVKTMLEAYARLPADEALALAEAAIARAKARRSRSGSAPPPAPTPAASAAATRDPERKAPP